jgi:hypothetical protein
LHRRPEVTVKLSALEAWILMSQIQLALRHPENKGEPAKIVETIARTIQKEFDVDPVLTELAEQGWHAEYDGDGEPP